MDMRIPPFNIKGMREANPLKSRILARRLAVSRPARIGAMPGDPKVGTACERKHSFSRGPFPLRSRNKDYIHIHTHIYLYLYLSIYIYIYIYMCNHMYTHKTISYDTIMHIYIYIYIQPLTWFSESLPAPRVRLRSVCPKLRAQSAERLGPFSPDRTFENPWNYCSPGIFFKTISFPQCIGGVFSFTPHLRGECSVSPP